MKEPQNEVKRLEDKTKQNKTPPRTMENVVNTYTKHKNRELLTQGGILDVVAGDDYIQSASWVSVVRAKQGVVGFEDWKLRDWVDWPHGLLTQRMLMWG